MSDFDIIVPIAKNDLEAFKKSLPNIKAQLPNAEIKVIANSSMKEQLGAEEGVIFIDENQMIEGMDFDTIKKIIRNRHPKAERRTGWYFQQFLKLGYARICDKEYFLSWDSDTIPLKGLTFFDEQNKPFFDVLPLVAEDASYNITIGELWKDGSVKKGNNVSFISEHMMFKTSVVNEMLDEIEHNIGLEGKIFSEKILSAIPISELNLSGFSEFETYAAYVASKKPALYTLRKWKNLRHGKVYFGPQPTQEQLDWAAEIFDAISIEDFDHQWNISKILCSVSSIKKYSFERVYIALEPFVKIIYKFRIIVRKIIRK